MTCSTEALSSVAASTRVVPGESSTACDTGLASNDTWNPASIPPCSPTQDSASDNGAPAFAAPESAVEGSNEVTPSTAFPSAARTLAV